jgi:IrrE N-terminal-like domain
LFDWFDGDAEERRALVKRFSADRDELLEQLAMLWEHFETLLPSQQVEAVLIDICGFDVVDEPLKLNQLALCDFEGRRVTVNSEMGKFVHHKTDLTLLRLSTLAHELGHIRLHGDEVTQGCSIHYVGDPGRFSDSRAYQKEREADLYAGIFLVPIEKMLQERRVQNLLRNLQNGRQMSSTTLWQLIYATASRFKVSPSLMKRCLLDFGWLQERKVKKGQPTLLELRVLGDLDSRETSLPC